MITFESEHLGDVVIATPLKTIENSFYNIEARIETGPLEKEVCLVRYGGKFSDYIKQMIVRVSIPPKIFLYIDGILCNFLNSEIPSDFSYCKAHEVILYGIWEDYMKGRFSVPIVGKINNHYPIGGIWSALHHTMDNGRTRSYILKSGKDPRLLTHDDGIPNGHRSALKRYLRSFKIAPDEFAPNALRLITIDYSVPMHLIISDFKETGMHYLALEPHCNDTYLVRNPM